MAIKAIAMDIDGTLTNDQKVISPRTREKLLAAQESGIKLICWLPLMARMWSTLRPMRSFLTRPCRLTSCTV